MSFLATFFRLPAADRRLAVEAFVWLGLARTVVLIFPFRWVAARLGQQHADATANATSGLTKCNLRRVKLAIRRVSPRTPWRSNCLAQALAGRCMLRRRQIASTMYLGVAKDVQGEFEAHAWLRSEGMILTGGTDLERYAVVARFTD